MTRVRRSPRLLDLGLTAVATAIGVWCSQGMLDRATSGAVVVRVAMLPGLSGLAAAVAAACGIVFTIAAALGWLAQPAVRRSLVDDYADWLKPLRGTVLLALPFLPWLSDVVPATQALAGPARWYVWSACVGLVALRSMEALKVKRSLVALTIGAAGLAAYAMVAGRLAGTPIFPGGDEPHYLVMTQSLLDDGDLRIENNHDRADYRAYYAANLDPHYRTRGTDREIYSIHPVGLPVLLVPIFAAGGYRGVVWALVVCSGMVAWLLWRRTELLVGSVSAASFAWAATFLSPAFVFNSFTVYPEMVAALVTTAVFLNATKDASSTVASGGARWWLMGCGAAALPWLSTKYAPLSAGLVAVCALRAWMPGAGSTGSADIVRRWTALIIPYVVGLACWFGFFYYIWGTPWPSAPYGADDQTSPRVLLRGGPGLLFDQEYGIVASAPALVLAFPGLWLLFKDGGAGRRVAAEIALLVAALWATVGAFELWWGGTAGIGRPVIAALGLFVIPIARAHREAAGRPATRALHYLLLIIGLTNVVVLTGAQEGLLLSANRSGRSTLLEWLSPSWPIIEVFPSFIAQSVAAATVTTMWWLAAGTAVAFLARRLHRSSFGATASAAMLLAAAAVAGTSAVVSATVAPASVSPLEGRARVPLLDTFDAERLPLAIRYDPLTRVPPNELLSGVSLVARRTDGRPRPPIPLLYNARYSLPAGHYLVELVSARDSTPVTAERLSLQLGRAGPTTQEWDVTLAAPGVWGRTFELPVDVGFVGFQASKGLEAAGFSLRVRPMSVVNAHQRVSVGQVLSVKRYGSVVAVFEDERAWPEDGGFWVAGGESVRFLVSPDAPAAGTAPTEIVLRLHSGEITNSVVLSARGKAERLELFPKKLRTIVLPLGEGATAITLAARDFFVPSQSDPQSRDLRHLGCWVEIVGFEEPQASAAPVTRGLTRGPS